MKTKTKWIFALGAACIGTLALGACAKPDTTHSDRANAGYTVVVTYDRNGGYFNGNPSMNVVDRYKYDDLKDGIKLVEPGDEDKRGSLAGSTSTISRSGYMLIGWYRTMELRADEQGNALDENGELVSETGNPQGHVFTDLWDFNSGICTIDDLQEGEENGKTVYTLTLYAAWAPVYTYAFYRPATAEELTADPNVEWVQYGSYQSMDRTSIDVPYWNEATGAVSYGNVPVYQGHTFEAVYKESTLETPCENDVAHSGNINYENGTATGMNQVLYTTWIDGTWFRISNAEQFITNLRSDGCYEILDDIDFSYEDTEDEGKTKYYDWNGGDLTFTGIIQSEEHHTISNIRFKQTSNSLTCSGGVFGSIEAGASITGVSFENIVYEVEYVSYRAGADSTYGLFAGAIDENAVIGSDVTISGTVKLGILTNMYDETAGFETNKKNFTIGLVSGNGVLQGLGYENCNVEIMMVSLRDQNGRFDGWFVTAEVGTDGELIISLNEDPRVDPNQN